MQRVRQERIENDLDSTFSDCRFALRQLHDSPGFTLTAILTLGCAFSLRSERRRGSVRASACEKSQAPRTG
jgi:hypothetical protein